MMILAALLAAQVPALVESQLADRLLDGESARWRWYPPKIDADGSMQLCGFLNAKNRIGAYGGFNPVWVQGRLDGDSFVIADAQIAAGPYLDGTAAKRCIAAGFNMQAIPPKE